MLILLRFQFGLRSGRMEKPRGRSISLKFLYLSVSGMAGASHWIWPEGIPAQIPKWRGKRVIVLGKVTFCFVLFRLFMAGPVPEEIRAGSNVW